MPVDRPTFSESWYRVAALRPRLRSTVQVHRQHFRGRMWHVLQDPASNQFFRLNEPAYQYVGMLDGNRTVAAVWQICNEQLGDGAPTQGEVIQLLGQLYTSNLLQAELPPDAEGLFRRYRKRRTREVRGYMMNLLFARIPLIDPDHFLDLWVRVLGRLFTWYGFVLWLILIAAGAYVLVPRFDAFVKGTDAIFQYKNLPLLYLAFIVSKLCHEFGHAFACKTFGWRTGSRGEVHIMGIMFLVFMPMPYVDASSAWAFRRKLHRAVVGAGGMLVEFAIAAIAVIVWANTQGATGSGQVVNALAHRVIFIASVSTLLFNINPLLRFDGYYILSDLTEIPNLSQRSRQYLYYLVRRYVWSVGRAQSPAHNTGERAWFVFYGIAATLFRVYICLRILLFIGDRLPRELFVVAMAFAALSVVAWAAVPLGRFLHYLATGIELSRTRGRAVASTIGAVAAAVVAVGLIPMPDRFYIEGVVKPVRYAIVHTKADGFLENHLPTGRFVTTEGPVLINDPGSPDEKEKLWARANPALVAQRQQLRAEQEVLKAQRSWALDEKRVHKAQGFLEQFEAKGQQIHRIEKELGDLSLRAPIDGTWIAWNIREHLGAYVPRGQAVGVIAGLDEVIVRATSGQDAAGILIEATEKKAHPIREQAESARRSASDARRRGDPGQAELFEEQARKLEEQARHAAELPAEIRVRGRVNVTLPAVVRREDISPAGQEELPSPALGYPAGGPVRTDLTDRTGTKAATPVFNIRIRLPEGLEPRPLCDQRVVVRVEAPPKPLILQWWRKLLQLVLPAEVK